MDLRQLHLETLSQLEVERPQRLVQEQDCGSVHERARHRNPLLLAARERPRQAVPVLLEPHEPQRLLDSPARLGGGDSRHLQPEPDVRADVHVREERVRLEDRVHSPPVRRQAVDDLFADVDLAARGVHEAADQVERRRLAAAGRTEQAEELALRDLEVGHPERLVGAVVLRDPGEPDCRRRVRHGAHPHERRVTRSTRTVSLRRP